MQQNKTKRLIRGAIGRRTSYTDELFNNLEEELRKLQSPNIKLDSIWEVPVTRGHYGDSEIKHLYTKGYYGVKQKGVRIYFDLENNLKSKIFRWHSNTLPGEEYCHSDDSEYPIRNEENKCFTPQVCYDSQINLFHRTFSKDKITVMKRLCLAYLLMFEEFKKEDLFHPFLKYIG